MLIGDLWVPGVRSTQRRWRADGVAGGGPRGPGFRRYACLRAVAVQLF